MKPKYAVDDKLYVKMPNKIAVWIVEIKTETASPPWGFVYQVSSDDRTVHGIMIAEDYLMTEDEWDAWKVMEKIAGESW
jgi:hypothetical protein